MFAHCVHLPFNGLQFVVQIGCRVDKDENAKLCEIMVKWLMCSDEVNMDVMDAQGRIVLKRRVSGRTTSLQRDDLGAGSYVLRLSNEQASTVVRFEVR